MTNPSFKRNAHFVLTNHFNGIVYNLIDLKSIRVSFVLFSVGFFSVPTINYMIFLLCHCRTSAHVFCCRWNCVYRYPIFVVSSKNSVYTAKKWWNHFRKKKFPLDHLNGIRFISPNGEYIKIEDRSNHTTWILIMSCICQSLYELLFCTPFRSRFRFLPQSASFFSSYFSYCFVAILKSLWFAPTY